MKVLLDMNLSPAWVDTLSQSGFEALHWMTVGDLRATDREVLDWAVANGCVILTQDLDFGAILAARGTIQPSVVQLRARDITPARMGSLVAEALRQYRTHLEAGALISIDETSQRARILPLRER